MYVLNIVLIIDYNRLGNYKKVLLKLFWTKYRKIERKYKREVGGGKIEW